jgi:hypothetical protein
LSQARKHRFEDFVSWFDEHIIGDEKEEGQIFLERFVQSFGNKGIKEAGAVCEGRVKKKSGSTGLVDLVWKPRMIFELKKRGENLGKHYDQSFEYWISLIPNRPRYMVLCNFDQFWIYDLNTQIHDPIHKLEIKNLPNEWAALAFLFPTQEEPVFNNNNVEATKQAAEIIGSFFFSLTIRQVDSLRAQRFVLQLVVALFAQDVNLIPKYTLSKILKAAVANPIIQQELTGLFKAMSTQKKKDKPVQYKKVAYFNGGLFNVVDPIELLFTELDLLYQASKQDWSKVRLSIFGTILESSMDVKKRHTEGVHFTSELDIQKIIYPSIVKPIKDKIEKALTKKMLVAILDEIRSIKVLDPSCGSGNFLYSAYRELVKLEMEVMEKMDEKNSADQIRMCGVSSRNFYGIDINGFGVELAKISLSIGQKFAAGEFVLHDNILPFDNLDSTIVCKDALFEKWPDVDVIIGNPPFLGKRVMRKELGDAYVEKVRERFKGVPRNIDFCAYWFRLAHDSKAQYFGLVGTNSIAQGFTREATLDYIMNNGGFIHNAVSSQEWSGEAAVHVSIVNWRRTEPNTYILDGREVETINSSLKSEIDVTKAARIKENRHLSFQGCNLTGKGFIVSEKTAKAWIKEDKKNKNILKPMLDGKSIVDPNIKLDWVIDFNNPSIEWVSNFRGPIEQVKKTVRPARLNNRDKQRREKWWLFGRSNSSLRKALEGLSCYFAISQVSKYTNFRSVDVNILPCEAIMVVASDDFYILGILNSKIHLDWVRAQSSTLKGDTRYTNTTCFETFPFPLKPSEKCKDEIRNLMTELENFRIKEVKKRNCTITVFYNDFFEEPNSHLYKLHKKLDRAVAEAYGWKFIDEEDYKPKLFDLNRALTSQDQIENV